MGMAGCRALTLGEFGDLLLACGEYLRPLVARRSTAIFMTMFFTGLRISECVSLHVGDVTTGGEVGGWVCLRRRFTKGKWRGREIPLHPLAQAELDGWIGFAGLRDAARDAWLFPGVSRGANEEFNYREHVTEVSVRYTLTGLAQRLHLGGRVSTHSFRHTFAERFLELCGENLLLTQAALDHADIKSTLSYLRLPQRGMAEVIMRMG